MFKRPFILSVLVAAMACSAPSLAQDDEKIEGEYEDIEGEYEEIEGDYEEIEGELEDVEGDFEEVAPEQPAPGGEGPKTEPAPTEPAPTEPAPAEPAPAEPAPAEPAPTEPALAEPAPAEPPQERAAAAPQDPSVTAEPKAESEAVEAEAPLPEVEDDKRRRRVGDPIPLTRREPLVNQFQFEGNIHYGLVGSGPTRLTNDVRFGLFDWWELRTAFLPHPSSLMSRFKIGSQQGPFGAFILDGGLAHFDAGIRLVPEEGEAEAGFRFHFEAGVAYTKAIGDRFSLWTSARTRYRYSLLTEDDQTAVAVDMQLTYDLLDNLAVSGGLAYAEVVGTKVRELAIDFAEPGRPGLSHFLLRNDGWSRSVTIPLALTYARIETFDVDVFVTPRVWPQFDLTFGAGLRWRFDVIKDTKTLINDASEYFTEKEKPADAGEGAEQVAPGANEASEPAPEGP